MKLIFSILFLATSALAAPSLLHGEPGEHQASTHNQHPSSHHEAAPIHHEVHASLHEAPLHASASQLHHTQVFSSHSQSNFAAPSDRSENAKVIGLIRDDRVVPDESGSYHFDIESEDGIVRSESGTVGSSGAIVQTGSYSFTLPNGQLFELKFVADENGFQPESSFLPAVPAYVQEQIDFAKANPEQENQHYN